MYVPITAEDLEKVPLFQGVTRDKLEKIASRSIRVVAHPNLFLARQGEAGFDFFVVLDGTAEVRVDGDAVASLGPGDVFGEMALMGGHQRNADVVAKTPMTLMTMMLWDFRALTQDYPMVAHRLEELVRSRANS